MPSPYPAGRRLGQGSPHLASPVFQAQNLHQLNYERRVIRNPRLVSSTATSATESAELLVAPLIGEISQEATSITAKLVFGTSTDPAERTPEIGVTFRRDEPATHSQRQRQHHPFRRHQKVITYSRTRNFYHPYDQRRTISNQQPHLLVSSTTNELAEPPAAPLIQSGPFSEAISITADHRKLPSSHLVQLPLHLSGSATTNELDEPPAAPLIQSGQDRLDHVRPLETFLNSGRWNDEQVQVLKTFQSVPSGFNTQDQDTPWTEARHFVEVNRATRW